jgi:hypothetical protein
MDVDDPFPAAKRMVPVLIEETLSLVGESLGALAADCEQPTASSMTTATKYRPVLGR